MGSGTHLTIYWRCSIKINHVEDYGYKGEDARKGVELLQVKVNALLWVDG